MRMRGGELASARARRGKRTSFSRNAAEPSPMDLRRRRRVRLGCEAMAPFQYRLKSGEVKPAMQTARQPSVAGELDLERDLSVISAVVTVSNTLSSGAKIVVSLSGILWPKK